MRGGQANAGRKPDPTSLRATKRPPSEMRVLPLAGYTGVPPTFPLPDATLHESSVWRWLWKTPQAAAWAEEEWRWLTIAMYARTYVRCAGEGAKTADVNSLHRFAEQIGHTPLGLKLNGWTIEKRGDAPTEMVPATAPLEQPMSAKDRLKLVSGQ